MLHLLATRPLASPSSGWTWGEEGGMQGARAVQGGEVNSGLALQGREEGPTCRRSTPACHAPTAAALAAPQAHAAAAGGAGGAAGGAERALHARCGAPALQARCMLGAASWHRSRPPCSPRPVPASAAYSLWANNCNNFSDEYAQLLCGTGVPPHITGVPVAGRRRPTAGAAAAPQPLPTKPPTLCHTDTRPAHCRPATGGAGHPVWSDATAHAGWAGAAAGQHAAAGACACRRSRGCSGAPRACRSCCRRRRPRPACRGAVY